MWPWASVHHQHIHRGLHQALHPLVVGGPHRRPDPQGVGAVHALRAALFADDAPQVLEAVKAGEGAVRGDHRQDADLVVEKRAVRLLHGDGGRRRHHVLHHDVGDARVVRLGIAELRRGHDPQQAAVGVQHGEAGEPEALLAPQLLHLGDGHVGREGARLGEEAVEVVLHLFDLGALGLGFEVLVDDPDATGQCHDDSHGAFGDRVHGGGDERGVHADLSRQLRRKVRLGGQEVRILRQQRHIVVGEPGEAVVLHELVQMVVLEHWGFSRLLAGYGGRTFVPPPRVKRRESADARCVTTRRDSRFAVPPRADGAGKVL